MTAVSAGLIANLALLASPAAAEPAATGPYSLDKVIANLQGWVMGLLAALATLFFIIGGARYVLSGGDPSQAGRDVVVVELSREARLPVLGGLLPAEVVTVQRRGAARLEPVP